MNPILFCGQLVCLVNAETIKNPCTNLRKTLVNRLNKLGADIGYIKDAFIDAERKTNVEVALIYVKIEREVEVDIFGELEEEKKQMEEKIETPNEVSTYNHYRDLVAEYNRTYEQVTNHLVGFYKHYKNVSKYLALAVDKETSYVDRYDNTNLTKLMRKQHNVFIKKLKKDYWCKVTALPEVNKYLTSDQREKLAVNISKFYCKEFTENNIRQFVLNLVKTFPDHIYSAIENLFDKITSYALRDSRWCSSEYQANIHYFNAWKTNNGYKVNKKIILPFYYNYASWRGWRLDYDQRYFLEDVEKVMRYFKPTYWGDVSIADICENHLERQINRKIETQYFIISIFKKGTIHLEFKDLDLLRRFNIEACKGKAFLPMDYAEQDFENLTEEQQQIVENFEGKNNYKPITDNMKVLKATQILKLENLQ